MASQENKPIEKDLPEPWNRLSGAVWLLGLALIAWKGWWWPGILVLVAISAFTQFFMRSFVSKKEKQQQTAAQQVDMDRSRAQWLPSLCPNCGGPLSVNTVKWAGPDTADCPYCSAKIAKQA